MYLIGEYRHEGKGKDRTVTIKLRAERAGKVEADAVERDRGGRVPGVKQLVGPQAQHIAIDGRHARQAPVLGGLL